MLAGLKHFWKFIAGPLAVLATILSAVLGWIIFAPGTLSYTVPKSQSLVAIQTYGAHKLELFVDGSPVQSPFITQVHIQNTGFKAIKVSDYTDQFGTSRSGLMLRVNNPSVVVAAEVNHMIPPTRATIKLYPQPKSVLIAPVALNPGESFDVQIITDGDPSSISVNGHLSDANIQLLKETDFWKAVIDFGSSVFPFMSKIVQLIGFLVSALITIVSLFVMAIPCFLIAWFVRTLYRWGEPGRFKMRVRSYATSPARALEILAGDELDSVTKDMALKKPEEKDRLRKVLGEIANEKPKLEKVEEKNSQEKLISGNTAPELPAPSDALEASNQSDTIQPIVQREETVEKDTQ